MSSPFRLRARWAVARQTYKETPLRAAARALQAVADDLATDPCFASYPPIQVVYGLEPLDTIHSPDTVNIFRHRSHLEIYEEVIDSASKKAPIETLVLYAASPDPDQNPGTEPGKSVVHGKAWAFYSRPCRNGEHMVSPRFSYCEPNALQPIAGLSQLLSDQKWYRSPQDLACIIDNENGGRDLKESIQDSLVSLLSLHTHGSYMDPLMEDVTKKFDQAWSKYPPKRDWKAFLTSPTQDL